MGILERFARARFVGGDDEAYVLGSRLGGLATGGVIASGIGGARAGLSVSPSVGLECIRGSPEKRGRFSGMRGRDGATEPAGGRVVGAVRGPWRDAVVLGARAGAQKQRLLRPPEFLQTRFVEALRLLLQAQSMVGEALFQKLVTAALGNEGFGGIGRSVGHGELT